MTLDEALKLATMGVELFGIAKTTIANISGELSTTDLAEAESKLAGLDETYQGHYAEAKDALAAAAAQP